MAGAAMISNPIENLLTKEQDDIARSMGYIDEARALLEDAFVDSTPPRKRRIVPMISVAAGLAAAATAAFILLLPRTLEVTAGENGRSLSEGSWVSSPMDESLQLSFSDGSSVNLSDNTEVRLQSLKVEGAHLLLERGQVAVSVVHRSETDWRVDAGPYKIAVTGTRFGVHWTPEVKAFSVEVQEGTIEVEGPMLADGKALTVGDRLVVSLLDNVAEIYKKDTYERIVSGEKADTDGIRGHDEIAPTENAVVSAEAPMTRDESVSNPHRKDVRTSPTSWQTLAKRGEWVDSVNAAEKTGIKTILTSGPASDVMLLGDAARLAKSYLRAAEAYKAVRMRFPGTAEAQRAAFTMGRIEFEAHGKYLDAVRWFRACIADNAGGVMTREASGRLVEALDRAGDRRGARNAAQNYLAAYQNGPHAALAKQILSKSSETL